MYAILTQRRLTRIMYRQKPIMITAKIPVIFGCAPILSASPLCIVIASPEGRIVSSWANHFVSAHAEIQV